jgi:chromosome partitioning protein
MLITPNRVDLNKIVILNPKGGCGKTTLATNLASYYAGRGSVPAVMDCDPQGSTMGWLEKRPANKPPIHGIAAYKNSMQATRSWQLRVPNETTRLIVDSPASLTHDDLREVTRDATSILVPVLPSAIDIHAASRCIADLLLVAKIDRRDRKLAVVANRTRQNTKSYEKLMRFLDTLGIPIIAVMRDSQNFVHAAEAGIGICELPPHKVRKDIEQLEQLTEWLDDWQIRRQQAMPTGTFPEPNAANVTVLHKSRFGSGRN